MKKLVITGAYSGLAKALIEQLKDENLDIYATVHTEKQYQNLLKRYEKNNNIHPLKVDVTTFDKQKIYDLKPDILLCNAALPCGEALLDVELDKIHEVFDVNVFSNFELIQTISRQMFLKDEGKIIVVSSLAGLISIPFMGVYSASKASLIKLVQTMKMEFKFLKSNVVFKMIEPGFYHTGFNQVMFDQKYQNDSYFKAEFDYLQKMDNLIYRYLELKNFKSIVNVMKKAVLNDDKKFIYHCPKWQSIPVKISQLWLD